MATKIPTAMSFPPSATSTPLTPLPPRRPHNITAKINYYRPRRDDMLLAKEDFLPIMRLGRDIDARDMPIQDIRDSEEEFSLDRNGFQVVTLPGPVGDSKDDEAIKAEYEGLEEVLGKLTGGSHVRIFNHIIRDDPPHPSPNRTTSNPIPNNAAAAFPNPDNPNPNPNPDGPRAPSLRPHLDFDSESCPAFFAQKRPLLKLHIDSGRRWQVIGLWRPVKTVYRDPLVLLDARTARNEDFVRMERITNSKSGGGGAKGDVPAAVSIIKHGERGARGQTEHRWCYLHEQRPEELWVFKHYDSLKEGAGAWRCGHTSVRVPGTMGQPCRESIEFRALVFY